MSASDDRHRRAGARVSVAFAYPSGQRCAGRSDGALRQPFSPLSSRCSGAELRSSGRKLRSADNPSLPMRMPYAPRGNNGKDRKANLAGGSLLTKMRKAYALFTFCKSPRFFYTKSKTVLST